MRWILKPSGRQEWHKWFAWHPVRLSNGERVWFETISRRQRWSDEDSLFMRGFCRFLCVIEYEYRNV